MQARNERRDRAEAALLGALVADAAALLEEAARLRAEGACHVGWLRGFAVTRGTVRCAELSHLLPSLHARLPADLLPRSHLDLDFAC